MKYGILGDIHANIEALEAVLEEMGNGGVEEYVSVGDIVDYGANPSECIAKIREIGATVVAGNHDLAVIGLLNVDFFNNYAKASAEWTRNVMNDGEKNFIANLKLVEKMDNFTVVHSTLNSPELFEYVLTSYDAHLNFDKQTTPVCFIGHSHIPVNFIKRKNVSYNMDAEIRLETDMQALVNVGSVGQPRDDNPQAVCVIYDSDEGVVRLNRVKYNVDGAMKKILDAGLPPMLAERLKYGR